MNREKVDKRKVHRLNRRAARRLRMSAGYSGEMDRHDAQIILDAVLSNIDEHHNEPRMELCTISRDQGITWTEELINVAITDPVLSTLKVGDLVKSRKDGGVYVIVANEGENIFRSPFQDDPNSPFYLPEGHLYRLALPYD